MNPLCAMAAFGAADPAGRVPALYWRVRIGVVLDVVPGVGVTAVPMIGAEVHETVPYLRRITVFQPTVDCITVEKLGDDGAYATWTAHLRTVGTAAGDGDLLAVAAELETRRAEVGAAVRAAEGQLRASGTYKALGKVEVLVRHAPAPGELGEQLSLRPAVMAAWQAHAVAAYGLSTGTGTCSVTGRPGEALARKEHISSTGLNAKGLTFIGSNLETADSYGQKQAEGASVALSTVHDYAWGLDRLLGEREPGREPGQTRYRHRAALGSFKSTAPQLLLWSPVGAVAAPLLLEQEDDDVWALLADERTLAQVIYRVADGSPLQGTVVPVTHVLLLRANETRAVVQLYHELGGAALLHALRAYYAAQRLLLGDGQRPVALWRLAGVLAVGGDRERLLARDQERLWRHVLLGEPLSLDVGARALAAFLSAHLRGEVSRDRLHPALLLAGLWCVSASVPRIHDPHALEATMTDERQRILDSPAYRLGQALALADDIQRRAVGRVGSSHSQQLFRALMDRPHQVLDDLARRVHANLSGIHAPGLRDHFEQAFGTLIAPHPLRRHTQRERVEFALGFYAPRPPRRPEPGTPDHDSTDADAPTPQEDSQ